MPEIGCKKNEEVKIPDTFKPSDELKTFIEMMQALKGVERKLQEHLKKISK